MIRSFAFLRSACTFLGIAIFLAAISSLAQSASSPVFIKRRVTPGVRELRSRTGSEGGRNVTTIHNGNYLQYSNIDFGNGIQCFEARVANAGGGGYIELHLGNPAGTIIGICEVRPSTGGWQTWASKACAINGTSGIQTLYLTFVCGSGNLFNLSWFKLYPARDISTARWRQSTSTSQGIYKGNLEFTADSAAGGMSRGRYPSPSIPARFGERIDGFGGAFNDDGWVSLQEVSSSAKDNV